jgi:integrase
MASITRQKKGRRTVQFVGSDGKRRSIRLGKASEKVAQGVRVKIEALVAASITGQAFDNETAHWLAAVDTVMADKLAAVGLVPKRQATALSDFLAGYLDNRTDVKLATKVVYGHTQRNLLEFFGPDKSLQEITPGDADDFRRYLIEQKLAVATVNRRCSLAKTFFRAAVRHELIPRNPFEDVRGSVRGNRDKMRFIDRQMTQRIIDACPDADWRLLVALARYGGLRCPSESLSLRWADVDWERDRVTVHSPKTEHHPGGASRVIPLFPELRPYLEEAWEEAQPGTEHVITRYRDAAQRTLTGWKNCNLRTQFHRIIRRAGIDPWPKVWQNLRSSRETELAEDFPVQVVCQWIGNSRPVALEHYLQVTDEHFRQATQPTPAALQNPVHPVQKSVPRPAACTRHGSQLQDVTLCGHETTRQDATCSLTVHPAQDGRMRIRTSDLVLIRDAL